MHLKILKIHGFVHKHYYNMCIAFLIVDYQNIKLSQYVHNIH